MTEQSNAELIAEARERGSFAMTADDQDLVDRLAERLEAAGQRAAEYAAVVEKVRAYAESIPRTRDRDVNPGLSNRSWLTAQDVLHTLATAPTDALREHDAKVRAEALREAYADLEAYTDAGAPFGHRPVEEFLLRRADRIEKEAGLK